MAADFEVAVAEFGRRVAAIKPDQWQAGTPDTDWNVRQLLNHVTGEYLWVPEILAGKTIAEVGTKFDGDILGDDPVAVYKQASAAATAAAKTAKPDQTVHLSFGDVPAGQYIEQMFIDSVIHGWDLAKGIGADESIAPELVQACWDLLRPQAEQWRSGGAFAAQVVAADDADLQTKLLALTGRRRS